VVNSNTYNDSARDTWPAMARFVNPPGVVTLAHASQASDVPCPPDSSVRSVSAELAALRAELSALERACAHYQRQLVIDPLTGLYDRKHFDERLEHEWRRALHFWTPLSLVVVDVAEPEALAERAWQPAFEATLAHLGWLLRSEVRDIDVAFRVGPASFAVLLPGTGRIGAEAELDRLERAAARERLTPPSVTSLSLGFGLAVALDDAHTPLELLIVADQAALEAHARCHADARHETIPILRAPSWLPAA
jgi:diguanylate cyclase (GGDEF)-like protein